MSHASLIQLLQWAGQSLQSFLKIKQIIADDLLVTYPHCEAPTNIMAGASDTVIGIVLQQ